MATGPAGRRAALVRPDEEEPPEGNGQPERDLLVHGVPAVHRSVGVHRALVRRERAVRHLEPPVAEGPLLHDVVPGLEELFERGPVDDEGVGNAGHGRRILARVIGVQPPG